MTLQIYGRYYYRDEYHVPHKITVVDKGPAAGLYWVVNGHLYKHQIFEKKPERFLIHINRVTI